MTFTIQAEIPLKYPWAGKVYYLLGGVNHAQHRTISHSELGIVVKVKEALLPKLYVDVCLPDPGGFSHWHGIRICACLLGHFFAKFGIAIGGFSSKTKEPKLHKLGVFWANYCKKHPIWSKLGAFLSKMVYWWVENLAKIGIEIVRFSRSSRHIHVRFWWNNPPGLPDLKNLTISLLLFLKFWELLLL